MALSAAAQQAWRAFVSSKSFDRVLNKVVLLSADNGKATAEMTVAEEHTNRIGTLHGGLTSTIVDIISGVALTSQGSKVGVSVDLHVTYMGAVKIGETVFIEAQTNKAGKTLAFLEVTLSNKDNGRIVAKGFHTKYVA